jgi:hypothetical protein
MLLSLALGPHVHLRRRAPKTWPMGRCRRDSSSIGMTAVIALLTVAFALGQAVGDIDSPICQQTTSA